MISRSSGVVRNSRRRLRRRASTAATHTPPCHTNHINVRPVYVHDSGLASAPHRLFHREIRGCAQWTPIRTGAAATGSGPGPDRDLGGFAVPIGPENDADEKKTAPSPRPITGTGAPPRPGTAPRRVRAGQATPTIAPATAERMWGASSATQSDTPQIPKYSVLRSKELRDLRSPLTESNRRPSPYHE